MADSDTSFYNKQPANPLSSLGDAVNTMRSAAMMNMLKNKSEPSSYGSGTDMSLLGMGKPYGQSQ